MTRFWRGFTPMLLLALVACGVPTDSAPRAIDADEVPFGLLDRDQLSTSTTTAPGAATVTVYLVSSERLAGVVRVVPAPETADDALRALLRGPSPDEAASGLRTAIGSSGGLFVSTSGGRNVGVELGRSFLAAGPSEQILAIAQIVYTMTGLEGVEGVRFTVDGRAVEVPRGDGTLTDGPLARTDFPALAPV